MTQAAETDDIQEQLRRLILEEAGLPQETDVAGDMRLEEDLGLDSLARLSLATALEQQYEVTITDEEFDAMQTFAEVCDLVRARLVG